MDLFDLAAKGKIKRILLVRNKADFPDAVSHITQHSCGSEPLFIEDSDYIYFFKLLKDKSLEFELKVFALCLMPNHIHFILRTKQANLSKAMQSLFRAYAGYFNKKYERKGHVFRGAFRQALCLGDSYLLAASLYIHLNPLNTGITIDYSGYRWSSCGFYVLSDVSKKETFVDFSYILQLLDADLNKAKNIYRDLLGYMAKERRKSGHENPAALENFRVKLGRLLNSYAIKKITDSTEGMLLDSEIEGRIYALKQRKRLRKSKDFQDRKFIITQLRGRGYRIAEIAEKLSLSRQTVSMVIKQAK